MFKTKILSRTIMIMIVFMLALSSVCPAYAAGINDSFATATSINSLPFSANTDTVGATYEPGEPYPPCGFGYTPNSTWFVYTANTDVSLTTRSNYFYSVLAVYTGSDISSLSPTSCSAFSPNFTFKALAGITYYFQLSTLYGGNFGDAGNIPFSLEVTPPPQVGFTNSPFDPNVFDNVSFSPYVSDPGNIGVASLAWASSDGAISDQFYFYHQFATDGDYTVNLTATTYDGRYATASQIIQVRTKDIAITSFSIPQTARVNQTKTINVNIQNKRYSDYVQVTLYKGTPGGGDIQIGTLTIYVPARASRPTTFKFSYTFTSDDAKIGKVTFKAIAYIVNGRDALPADNTSIATTIVSK